jgi:hypothetical protein
MYSTHGSYLVSLRHAAGVAASRILLPLCHTIRLSCCSSHESACRFPATRLNPPTAGSENGELCAARLRFCEPAAGGFSPGFNIDDIPGCGESRWASKLSARPAIRQWRWEARHLYTHPLDIRRVQRVKALEQTIIVCRGKEYEVLTHQLPTIYLMQGISCIASRHSSRSADC